MMVNKCCVPKCKPPPSASRFTFPSDPVRRQAWIEAIPRQDFVPTKYSIISSSHFDPKYILTKDCVTREDGSLLVVPRMKPKLSSDAVPTQFYNSLVSRI